jgi:REP element-mobilizing transposase RayT
MVVHHQRRHTRLAAAVYGGSGRIALLTTVTRERARVLADPLAANLMMANIRLLHGDRWRVLGYCVMPDHVHLLALSRGPSLIDFVRLLKGRSAADLRRFLGLHDVWQKSFNDHLVRRTESLGGALRYLLDNPVRAGLVTEWGLYPWAGSLEWPDLGQELAQAGNAVVWSQALDLPP